MKLFGCFYRRGSHWISDEVHLDLLGVEKLTIDEVPTLLGLHFWDIDDGNPLSVIVQCKRRDSTEMEKEMELCENLNKEKPESNVFSRFACRNRLLWEGFVPYSL